MLTLIIERQLQINCIGNERGGIAVDGIVLDRVGDGNELRFRFDIDQTYLPRIHCGTANPSNRTFPNKIHSGFRNDLDGRTMIRPREDGRTNACTGAAVASVF